MPPASSCSPARRSTPGWATSSPGSGGRPGCRSRRSTASTATTARRCWSSCSRGCSQLLVYHFMFGPSYQAGCPVNSSIADSVNGVVPHLHARDVTMLFVSQAPVEKLQAYKQRMGWSFPGLDRPTPTSTSTSASPSLEEQAREAVAQMRPPGLETFETKTGTGTGLPPIVEHNARSSGTDPVGYLTESPGFSSFIHNDGTRLPHLLDHLARTRVRYGLLPHPRPRTQRPRRRRRLATLDPPPR